MDNEETMEDSLKQMSALAEPYAKEIEKLGRNSVSLPSMPREAVIKSIHKNKKYAKVRFMVKGEYEDDSDVPILQPNYKIEGNFEGNSIGITMKPNLIKGDKVLIAYQNGKLGSPVIIGKSPK